MDVLLGSSVELNSTTAGNNTALIGAAATDNANAFEQVLGAELNAGTADALSLLQTEEKTPEALVLSSLANENGDEISETLTSDEDKTVQSSSDNNIETEHAVEYLLTNQPINVTPVTGNTVAISSNSEAQNSADQEADEALLALATSSKVNGKIAAASGKELPDDIDATESDKGLTVAVNTMRSRRTAIDGEPSNHPAESLATTPESDEIFGEAVSRSESGVVTVADAADATKSKAANPVATKTGDGLHIGASVSVLTNAKSFEAKKTISPDNGLSVSNGLSANSGVDFASKEMPSWISSPGELARTLSDDKASPARLESTASVIAPSTTAENKSAETSMPSALRLSLHNPRFNDVLSNQVLWQSKQGMSQADIHLNPAELGPITVKLTQVGSETTVQFVVAHPATKEQLEQALPRLREVFQSGGLQLGHVDVQDGRKQSQEQGQSQPPTATPRHVATHQAAINESVSATRHAVADGIVDFYA